MQSQHRNICRYLAWISSRHSTYRQKTGCVIKSPNLATSQMTLPCFDKIEEKGGVPIYDFKPATLWLYTVRGKETELNPAWNERHHIQGEALLSRDIMLNTHLWSLSVNKLEHLNAESVCHTLSLWLYQQHFVVKKDVSKFIKNSGENYSPFCLWNLKYRQGRHSKRIGTGEV